ncbi:retrovirus-related pol polyprotein from transposon TNT 1-94 [Tanacetum coccineum]
MTGAKFDIEKFDETGDFGLWRIKMRALLIQHGCEAALEVLPADMEAEAKAKLNRKSHSAVILCLGNKVLREVTGETIVAEVWSNLEALYMTKSLANKLYLKKKLYTFYMPAGRKISDYIDVFNKIILDLSNIEVKFEDEDLALLLLTSLPASYRHFVDTLLYRWVALTLEDVMVTLNSKEIKESVLLGDNMECKIRSIGKVSLMLVLMKRQSYASLTQKTRTYQRGETTCTGKAGSVWQEESRFIHEAFGKFKEWKQLVENQTRRIVKKLRKNNGLEFYNREFEQLCIKSGIARHLTVARMPPEWLYKLDNESPKIVTSRDVVFNESVMYKDMLKDHGADQEDGDDTNVGDQETNQASDLIDYQLVRDGEPRTTTRPLRFQDEAVICQGSSKWKAAMKEEMNSLRKNKNWEYMARLVVRGFTHRAGIDYNELFSRVVQHTSIRVILLLTTCKDYELEKLDVKTTFLHGNLEEVIYMRQPPGYEKDDMLITYKSKAEIGSTKSLLKKEFDIKELGEAKKIIRNYLTSLALVQDLMLKSFGNSTQRRIEDMAMELDYEY